MTGRSVEVPPSPSTLAVFAVFLCGVLAFTDLYATQPILPLLCARFHATEAQAGWTISATTFGVALSASLLGLFAERIDRKRMIIACVLLLTVPTFLTATSHGLVAMSLWRFLQGMILPGVFTITIAYITEEWPPHQIPRVMSRYVAGTVAGGFVGRALTGELAEHFNWQTPFLVLGCTGVMGAFLLMKILPAPQARNVLAPVQGHRSPLAPYLENIKNPKLLATFGIGFMMLFTLVSMFTYITFVLAAPPHHLSPSSISYLFSVYIFGLVATILVGKHLVRVGLRAGMLFAMSVSMIGVLLTWLPSLMAISAGLALTSCGVFIAQTCANSYIRDVAAPGGRVSAVGLYITCYYIGGTAGGVFPSVVWHRAGWPGCVCLVLALLSLAMAITVCGWGRSRRDLPVPL